MINELEKWLNYKIQDTNLKGCSYEQTYITGKWNAYEKVLNKIKKLKEDNEIYINLIEKKWGQK